MDHYFLGWPLWAVQYMMDNHGLVSSDCYSYKAKDSECPMSCEVTRDWAHDHKCECTKVRTCIGADQMKACLQSGPITMAFDLCESFYNYKKGVYECDCAEPMGRHSADCVGYRDDDKDCYWIVKNTWGLNFGEFGYVRFDCDSCGIESGHVNANFMCEEII